MPQYFYEGERIEYAGFMIDGKYCFRYVDFSDVMLYFTKAKLDTLQKA